MSVTVHTVYLCSVTVLQCKWPRALLLLLNIFYQEITINITVSPIPTPIQYIGLRYLLIPY